MIIMNIYEVMKGSYMKKFILVIFLIVICSIFVHRETISAEAENVLSEIPYLVEESNIFSDNFVAKQVSGLNNSILILTEEDRVLLIWISAEIDPISSRTIYVKHYRDLTDLIALDENEKVKSVHAAYEHYLVLTDLGKLYSWGSNDKGQLGNGTFESSNHPSPIESNFNLIEGEFIAEVSVGYFHSLAITSNDRVFTWGGNYEGELGDNTTTRKNIPVDITSYFNLDEDDQIKKASLGHTFSMLLTEKGQIFSWGDNYYGQLGNNNDKEIQLTPQDITQSFELSIDEKVINIALGSSHSMAVTSNNRVFTWGYNIFKQLGIGSNLHQKSPQDITSSFGFFDDEDVSSISLGGRHSGLITTHNRVFMWGDNSEGELAIGPTSSKDVPFEITSYLPLKYNESIIHIDLASSLSVFITSSGRVLETNEEGLFATEVLFNPVEVEKSFLPVSDEIIEYGTSGQTTYIMTENHEVYTWGKNTGGNIGNQTISHGIYHPMNITKEFDLNEADNIENIELSLDYGIALSRQGNVFAWGKSFSSIFGYGVPSSSYMLSPVNITDEFALEEDDYIVDFSAGESLLAVITSKGELHLWGNQIFKRSEYEVYNPMYYSKNMTSWFDLELGEYFVDVAIGRKHGILLTNENQVYVFGDNNKGQLGIGSLNEALLPINITSMLNMQENESIIKIQASHDQTAILTSNHRLISFGASDFGSYGQVQDDTIPNDITQNMGLLDDEFIVDIHLSKSNLGIKTSESRILMLGLNRYFKISQDYSESHYFEVSYDISNRFNFLDSEMIDSFALSDDMVFVKTSMGRLFLWGDNYYGQLGNGSREDETSPYELNRVFSNDHQLLKTMTESTHYFQVDRFKLTIIPEYSILDQVTHITVNNVAYEVNPNFSNEFSLTVFVPNDGQLDEEIYFQVNSLTFSNGDTINVFGDTTTKTTLISSKKNPHIEFLYDNELYVEEGLGNNDLLTAIAFDESYNPAQLFIQGTVDWDEPGQYIIKYSAFDEVANSTTVEKIVTVFEEITYSEQVILDMTFINANDETVENQPDLYNPKMSIHYGELTLSLISNDISLNAGDNHLMYSTIIGNRLILIDKIYSLADTESPELDGIGLYQTIMMYPYENIDWTYLLIDVSDNSKGNIVFEEVSDETIYNAGGFYDVVLTATDVCSNVLTFNIRVINKDFIPPVLEPIEDQIIEAGHMYYSDLIDSVAQYSDDGIGEIDLSVFDTNLDLYIPGVYYFTIKARDENFNTAFQTFNITIIDTTPPEIYLPSLIEVEVFSEEQDWTSYIDIVRDNSHSELTVSVIEDTVNYHLIGRYDVQFSVMDASGNETIDSFVVHVRDTIEPEVNLIGDSFITHEIGTDYIDSGVSCFDNYDDDCRLIVNMNDVNFDQLGEYKIVYSAVDSSGNKSLETIERTILIVDTMKPIIEIESEFTFEIGDAESVDWLRKLNSISDNNPNGLEIIIDDQVDYYNTGTYNVTITAHDESLNQTVKNIIVHIVDTIAPSFTIYQSSFEFEAGAYESYDFTSIIKHLWDNSYVDPMIYQTGDIDYKMVGEYTVIIGAIDDSENRYEIEIMVEIVDTTGPSYSLLEIFPIEAGTISVDWKEYIIDIYENSNRDVEIEIETDINYDIPGEYTVIFNVSDGYYTHQKNVEVSVVDTTKPKVFLNPSLDSVSVGETYTEYGVEVIDVTDTNVVLDGMVDTNTVGVYELNYIVTDTSGNETIIKRYVTVYEQPTKVEFELGYARTTLLTGEDYTDGSCRVIVNGEDFECQVKENKVDTTTAGIYWIEYSFILGEKEYRYKRYIYVINSYDDLELYIDLWKEEDEK